MDFQDSLAAYLLGNLDLKCPRVNSKGIQIIDFKGIGNNETGVAIIDAPSSTSQRYFNHDRGYDALYQVVVKSRDQKLARDEAFLIYQDLDDLPRFEDGDLRTINSDNESFILRVCEGNSLPRFFEETDHNAYIYTFTIRANLEINKK